MSYDITFKCKVQDKDTWVRVGDQYANITWNVREMIEKTTGLDWDNGEDNGLCTEVIPHIREGLKKLRENEEYYMQFNSPNGWGTTTGCKHFFETILEDWDRFTDYYPELIDVVHFWIE